VPVECDVESLSDKLPEALEAVTRQGAGSADASGCNGCQPDEKPSDSHRERDQRFRAKVQGDVLGRLLKAIEEERGGGQQGSTRRQGEWPAWEAARRRWRGFLAAV